MMDSISEEHKAIIRLTAREAVDAAFEKQKIYIGQQIQTHSLKCELGKYRGIKNFITAAIGGGIVAVFDWLRK